MIGAKVVYKGRSYDDTGEYIEFKDRENLEALIVDSILSGGSTVYIGIDKMGIVVRLYPADLWKIDELFLNNINVV